MKTHLYLITVKRQTGGTARYLTWTNPECLQDECDSHAPFAGVCRVETKLLGVGEPTFNAGRPYRGAAERKFHTIEQMNSYLEGSCGRITQAGPEDLSWLGEQDADRAQEERNARQEERAEMRSNER